MDSFGGILSCAASNFTSALPVAGWLETHPRTLARSAAWMPCCDSDTCSGSLQVRSTCELQLPCSVL